jgi:hypothetical protein
MNNKISISLILLYASLNLFGQVNDDSIRQVVLKNNVTDSLYVFGKWSETDGTETHLIYLGTITSPQGIFKIMTSSWFWGQSKRATSRILIFNEKNEFLGNYYVGMTYDLPEKIENNQVVFLHSNTDECDKHKVTRLSFESGIPDVFFLECKDGYGDMYKFAKE